MKLYNSQVSGNCYKVRMICAHLGLEYEIEEIDVVDRSNRANEMPADAPSTRVPLLQLDDGRYLTESNAILAYLAEGSAYLPSDPYERARVMGWLFFEQNHVEATIAVSRYIIAIAKRGKEMAEVLDFLRGGGDNALERLEAQLAKTPFLHGEQYTIADIAVFGYSHVAHEGGWDMERYPNVQAWFERIRQQPGYVPLLAQ